MNLAIQIDDPAQDALSFLRGGGASAENSPEEILATAADRVAWEAVAAEYLEGWAPEGYTLDQCRADLDAAVALLRVA